MLHEVARRFRRSLGRASPADSWSLRVVASEHETISVRRGVLEPTEVARSAGAMVTVACGRGVGYAATSDLTAPGLVGAFGQARRWAELGAELGLASVVWAPPPAAHGRYRTPVKTPWDSLPLGERIELVRAAAHRLGADASGRRRAQLADWLASLERWRSETLLVSSEGARIEQGFDVLSPSLVAVAHRGSVTQRRSHGGGELARQGGIEQLTRVGFLDQASRVAEEAIELLSAPDCPSTRCDVVLLPGQMILQIHESIGHALELDRILGDERNFAGSSFVTPEMFGHYQFGSALLNVTFDNSRAEELASYAFDDAGTRAERFYLIRSGMLERAIGGASSQARSSVPGVAAERAAGWNRPPIDRMANVNLEPGETSLAELVGSVERGVLMDTNRSWSIDERRLKFQFGCEYGRWIENGELRGVVRNPGYRGVTTDFWHRLVGVGDAATLQVLGTTDCGKGEPGQYLHVGHATPACRFRDVEVVGGATPLQ